MTGPLACPRGHHNIQLSSGRFHCQTCRQYHDPPHNWDKNELVDLRENPQVEG